MTRPSFLASVSAGCLLRHSLWLGVSDNLAARERGRSRRRIRGRLAFTDGCLESLLPIESDGRVASRRTRRSRAAALAGATDLPISRLPGFEVEPTISTRRYARSIVGD